MIEKRDIQLDYEVVRAVADMYTRQGFTKQMLLEAADGCMYVTQVGPLQTFAELIRQCLDWGLEIDLILYVISEVPESINCELVSPGATKLLTPLVDIKFIGASYHLTRRIQNIICYNDRKYVGDLVKLTRYELSEHYGCGSVCMDRIEAELARMGFQLGMSARDPVIEEFERLRPRKHNR